VQDGRRETGGAGVGARPVDGVEVAAQAGVGQPRARAEPEAPQLARGEGHARGLGRGRGGPRVAPARGSGGRHGVEIGDERAGRVRRIGGDPLVQQGPLPVVLDVQQLRAHGERSRRRDAGVHLQATSGVEDARQRAMKGSQRPGREREGPLREQVRRDERRVAGSVGGDLQMAAIGAHEGRRRRAHALDQLRAGQAGRPPAGQRMPGAPGGAPCRREESAQHPTLLRNARRAQEDVEIVGGHPFARSRSSDRRSRPRSAPPVLVISSWRYRTRGSARVR